MQRTYTRIMVKRFDDRGRGRSCVVARARFRSGGYTVSRPGVSLGMPRLDGRYVYWQRTFLGEANVVSIRRRPLPTRRCHPRGRERARPVPGQLLGLAFDRGQLIYMTRDNLGTTIYQAPVSDFRSR